MQRVESDKYILERELFLHPAFCSKLLVTELRNTIYRLKTAKLIFMGTVKQVSDKLYELERKNLHHVKAVVMTEQGVTAARENMSKDADVLRCKFSIK